ncbi:MAG: hypothetical protein DMD54_05575 [Gemmatimonadetes bacterium]|nr:MAG: hypothetical protein DMD54_05575 [Gemmatimonadota bacterium]
MFRPILTLAAVGFVGIALWKIASALLLPLVFLVFKIALIVGVVMAVFWWFKNKKDRKEDTPPVSE